MLGKNSLLEILKSSSETFKFSLSAFNSELFLNAFDSADEKLSAFEFEMTNKDPNEALIFYAVCFVLFRYFDIMKPFPVSYFDKKHKNSFGVIMDDVCAGLYVCLLYTSPSPRDRG